MSIGEPRHTPPRFVLEALTANLRTLSNYPTTLGVPQFRQAVAAWLTRRFSLPAAPGECRLDDPARQWHARSPVRSRSGTHRSRACIRWWSCRIRSIRSTKVRRCWRVLSPGSWVTTRADEYLPDLDGVPETIWRRCQLLFLCSPGNPTGAVASVDYLRRALELADRYDFVIASDECYSEIYLDEANPPPGLLQAALAAGHRQFERCLVFHSLSKRSSVPGLRSGFVAGDPALIKPFLLYRTYHGCAMPLHTQLASIPAWNDDQHVIENRSLYRQKFAAGAADPEQRDGSQRTAGQLLSLAAGRRRRTIHARPVRAPARHDAAWQLHCPRVGHRQSRSQSRAHLAGREYSGVRGSSGTDSRLRRGQVMQVTQARG